MSAAPAASPSASAASAALSRSLASPPMRSLVSRSRNATTWLSGSAPMKPSAGWPLTKAITAGIDWMPIWPGMAGCSSMFILTSLTLPLAAFTAFSRTGVSCLHGPHHGAQKSTSTGWRLDSSMTSLTKVCVVVSLTTRIRRRGSSLLQHVSCPRLRRDPAGRNLPVRPIKWEDGGRMQSGFRACWARKPARSAADARSLPGISAAPRREIVVVPVFTSG